MRHHHEMDELDPLLDYLIQHNKDHTEEIVMLAEKAKGFGEAAAYDDLMMGVEEMSRANESLRRALSVLRAKNQ